MDEKLIKIRDFAEAHGCTPQNIYLHLKTYAQELDGHLIKGKGRQGILLDEFAQEFLRSVMYPKELGENTVAEENQRLEKALAVALQENAKLLSRALTAEAERDQALIREGDTQRLLMASQEAQEAQGEELRRAKVDIQALTEINQETRKEADKLHLDLNREKSQREAAETRAQAAEDQNQALKERNLWERIIRKGE